MMARRLQCLALAAFCHTSVATFVASPTQPTRREAAPVQTQSLPANRPFGRKPGRLLASLGLTISNDLPFDYATQCSCLLEVPQHIASGFVW